MKPKFKTLVMLLVVIIATVIFTRKTSAQQPYVSYQVFYDELSPYGEWVNYPHLGIVWIPDVGPDFVPYSTEGHWIFTDYGWTWLSNYTWGWAPFHYGRWDYDNYYGWLWIPDNEWGPAWVNWRRADGYYGWSPMRPGISLSISFGRGYDNRIDHWMFVRDRDIDRADINHYYISSNEQDRIGRRSVVINNTYIDNRRNTTYVVGPDRRDYQKATGRQVNPVAIQENDRPGQDLNNGRFRIYRPEVVKNNQNDNRSAPSRITNLKDVKQPSERNATDRRSDPNNVKPSQPLDTYSPDNVRGEDRSKNIKIQSTDPTQNIRREQQQNNVRQQDNVKQQDTKPPQNIRREQQQNDVKQQDNVQQQKTNSSGNNRREQQSAAKATRKANKEQQKQSKTIKDNKEKN